jgi:NAD(P)-dependent dehydrogenase (short-subunit alcohol dehydrogenase family)
VMGLVGLASPFAGSVGYAAAKHGVVGLMRSYANLLLPQNIRVNSIHPAGVRTPMIDNEFTRKWLLEMAGDHDGERDMAGAVDMETVEPEVIADTVAWLVSDAGKHISGVALPVDDGYVNKR